MRWQEPVFPGDVLELEGTITRKYSEGSERRIDVELVCRRRGGGIAVTAWETFVVEADLEPSLEGGRS
jgi:acyl dehydratase